MVSSLKLFAWSSFRIDCCLKGEISRLILSTLKSILSEINHNFTEVFSRAIGEFEEPVLIEVAHQVFVCASVIYLRVFKLLKVSLPRL